MSKVAVSNAPALLRKLTLRHVGGVKLYLILQQGEQDEVPQGGHMGKGRRGGGGGGKAADNGDCHRSGPCPLPCSYQGQAACSAAYFVYCDAVDSRGGSRAVCQALEGLRVSSRHAGRTTVAYRRLRETSGHHYARPDVPPTETKKSLTSHCRPHTWRDRQPAPTCVLDVNHVAAGSVVLTGPGYTSFSSPSECPPPRLAPNSEISRR